MKNLATICLAFFLSAVALGQTIDSDNSYVDFKIGNMGLMSVKGTFTGMEGNINWNSNEPTKASFDVRIYPASVNTDNEKRDDHLRTEDFFNLPKYNFVSFKSTSVTKTDGGFLAKGKLTMLATTLDVEIPFTYADNTLTGEIEVDRLDYGLGEGTGTFMVGDTVEATIVCKLK